MIAIIDYGIGNLRSVEKALQHVGADVRLTGDSRQIRAARGVVLPGVGAFGDCITQLQAHGLASVVRNLVADGVPLLGICVGLQLLFEESEEMGRFPGLGLLPGRVRRFQGDLKVPHIGWNQVHSTRPSPLLAGIAQDSYAYFVHSYYVDPADEGDILAVTDYGGPYASVVGRGQLFGVQFHPEKSQEVGLAILRNFCAIVENA